MPPSLRRSCHPERNNPIGLRIGLCSRKIAMWYKSPQPLRRVLKMPTEPEQLCASVVLRQCRDLSTRACALAQDDNRKRSWGLITHDRQHLKKSRSFGAKAQDDELKKIVAARFSFVIHQSSIVNQFSARAASCRMRAFPPPPFASGARSVPGGWDHASPSSAQSRLR